MRKLVFGFTLLLAFCAGAKEAHLTVARPPSSGVMSTWTPLSISLVTPVALPPGFWDVKGLEVGVYNWTENLTGLQVGLVNTVDVFKGLQVGVVNVARQAYGLQLGLVNVIQDKDVPFLPLINGAF